MQILSLYEHPKDKGKPLAYEERMYVLMIKHKNNFYRFDKSYFLPNPKLIILVPKDRKYLFKSFTKVDRPCN